MLYIVSQKYIKKIKYQWILRDKIHIPIFRSDDSSYPKNAAA